MPKLSTPKQFATFGEMLIFFRKRARLTQAELSRAVGYSREQISRLEHNKRLPDVAAVRALFIPALGLEHNLADAQQLIRLAQQTHSDDPQDSPTWRPKLQDKLFTHLPASRFPLIGRATLVTTLQEWLHNEQARLYTLLGPPGVGKTRLALEIGWRSQTQFADGVCWVDLAAVEDPSTLLKIIRQQLKFPEPVEPTEAAELEQLRYHLTNRHLLLILDNFEQIIEAQLAVAQLLNTAVGLTILITSRLPLQIYGEQRLTIPPLSLPTATDIHQTQRLAQNPAVALFMSRAQAVQPTLKLTHTNQELIIAICTHLDGLPLAIELAVGNLHTQTIPELWAELCTHPTELNNGPLDFTQRQRSLRGAIEWSTQRLSQPQQQLFAQLAVFRGGFTPEAVKFVCKSDHLHDLYEANLIQPQDKNRFFYLETIRAFALEQFNNSADVHTICHRHAQYILELVTRAREAYTTADLDIWQGHLAADYHNIMAALKWSQTNLPEVGLAICSYLWRFWYLWGRYHEGRSWLHHFLDQLPEPTAARARALRGLGVLFFRSGKYMDALPFFEESLALYRLLADEFGIAVLHTELSGIYQVTGQLDLAYTHFKSVLPIFRSLNNLSHLSWSLSGLATIAVNQKRPWEEIAPLQTEMIACARQAADPRHLAWVLALAGDNLRLNQRLQEAHACYEETHQLAHEVNDIPAIAYAILRCGHLALLQGDHPTAETLLVKAFHLACTTDTISYITQAIALLAIMYWQQQRWERGVQLLTAAEILNPEIHKRLPAEQSLIKQLRHTAKQALGDISYAQALQIGSQLQIIHLQAMSFK